MSDTDPHHGEPGEHHPHVVPMKLLVAVIVTLCVLTGVTVWTARGFDLGSFNVPLAMFIATVKATLVAAFFMHLRWDKPFNSVVLITSVGFLGLFLFMACLDTGEYQPTLDRTFAEQKMAVERKVLARKALGMEAGAPITDAQVHEALYSHGKKEDQHGAVDAKTKEIAVKAKALLGALPASMAAPTNNPTTPEKVALGRALYFDTRLSVNNSISCNSCHLLDKFGVDNLPTSPGHHKGNGERNSPTVYNAGFHAFQFWDGRAETLEEQAKGPIVNPIEMGMPSEAAAVQAIQGVAGYAPLFRAAFGADDAITFDNIANAIGAFERTLIMRAPFDDFVEGKHGAISADAVAGADLFMSVGCTTCHTGPNLGGSFLKKLGDRVPYPTKDEGRFQVTKKEGDKFIFKVPGLRNVAKTGPYFHDGSVASLGEAVKLMAKHQLDKDLKDDEVKKLVTFLESLTGTIDPAKAKAPALPQ